MKKNTRILTLAAVALGAVTAMVLAILSVAGGNLDVVGSQSALSFNAVLAAVPALVTEDTESGGWSLAALDGEARFIWSRDLGRSSRYDAMIELDAAPFIDAGLDTAKLPEPYTEKGGMLTVGAKYGQAMRPYAGNDTPLAAYRQLAARYPDAVNYHTAMDHFGIKLGNGNMFEWAKDLAKNTSTGAAQDKDIVFALNPDPLIAAGVNPANVKGWAYAQVQVDENSVPTLVYRFLKPFDIP